MANNNSVLNKAAVKVWHLVEEAKPLQLENIVDTLTRKEVQKLQLDCFGCKANDADCNCTFRGIMTENTFNIDLMIAETGSSTKWCPSRSATSNFFQCNATQSISSSMLCDGVPHCPNGLDEALMMCNVEDIVYVAPVLAVFLLAVCLATALSIWGLEDGIENESETEGSPNSNVTRTLEDMKEFILRPTRQNEKNLIQSIQKMGLQDKVDLLKDTYNIDIKGQEMKGQMLKMAVEKTFTLKSEERPLLLLVKNSVMPTAFKTRVIDLVKMGCITNTLNTIKEKIPPKEMTYLKLIINVCKTVARIFSFPSQDIKDLATILVIQNFYNNVIQQRTEMIDNIDLNSIISLLVVIYAFAQLLRLKIASSTALPIRIPRCFPFGFKCNPGWVPIFTETFISIGRLQNHWQIFTSKLAIVQGIQEIKKGETNTAHAWKDIQNQSSHMNRMYVELENLDFKEKRIKIAAVLGDIIQGAVLLVLLLRSDLRTRGILGLAKLAGRLNMATKTSDISGKERYLQVLNNYFFCRSHPSDFPYYLEPRLTVVPG